MFRMLCYLERYKVNVLVGCADASTILIKTLTKKKLIFFFKIVLIIEIKTNLNPYEKQIQ